MGRKRVDAREKIVQRSVGLNFRHIEFLNDHPNFKVDKYCRLAIDEQIRILGEHKYLKNESDEIQTTE